MTSKPASLLKRLLFGLTVTAAILGLTEVGLRLALGAPLTPRSPQEVLGQASAPLMAAGRIHSPRFEESFSTRASWPRVAVLGGSSVRGGSGQLRSYQEFPALAGERAQVEVLNLGWPGNDSRDLLEQTRMLVRADFSALVFYTGHNDYGNIRFNMAFGSRSGAGIANLRRRLARLQLFCLIRDLGGPGGEPALPVLSIQQIQQATTQLESNLRQIIELCREQGIQVVLVTPARRLAMAPDPQPCEQGRPCAAELFEQAHAASDPAKAAELLRRARDADHFALSAPTEAVDRIRSLGELEGVAVLDAASRLPPHRGTTVPADDLFEDGIHFSPQGHAAMGVVLGASLSKLLWQECLGDVGAAPPSRPRRR